MQTLIAGGSGLVGTHLAHRLVAHGHAVSTLTRSDDERAARLRAAGVHVVVADVAEAAVEALTEGRHFDHVVYLAQSSRFREFPGGANDMSAVNVASAVRLAQWSAEHGVGTFAYASTGAVYSSSTTPHHEDEAIPYGSLGMYAASKAAGEFALAPFSALMRVVMLRPFFVYGPGMNATMLMNSLINSVRDGNTVKLFGDEDGLRLQPTAAKDAAAQIDALIQGSEPLTVSNIVGDCVYSLRTIATAIGDLVGRAAIFEHVPGAPQAVLADDTRIRSIAGPCSVGLTEGIREMLRR